MYRCSGYIKHILDRVIIVTVYMCHVTMVTDHINLVTMVTDHINYVVMVTDHINHVIMVSDACFQGTFGEREGLEASSECTQCTAGSWCKSKGRVDVQGEL